MVARGGLGRARPARCLRAREIDLETPMPTSHEDGRAGSLMVGMLEAREQGDLRRKSRWRWVNGLFALPMALLGLLRTGTDGSWWVLWALLAGAAVVSIVYWAVRHYRDVLRERERKAIGARPQ